MFTKTKSYVIFFLGQGKMAEWSNAHAWKACEVRASAGSNPVLSAKDIVRKLYALTSNIKSLSAPIKINGSAIFLFLKIFMLFAVFSKISFI